MKVLFGIGSIKDKEVRTDAKTAYFILENSELRSSPGLQNDRDILSKAYPQ